MASPPTTTLFPLAQLPPCANKCGPLFDANGACVPPAAPVADESTYAQCFCNYGALQPFKTGLSGVCDTICLQPGDDPAGISSVHNWFTSFCSVDAAVATNPVATATVSGRPVSGGAARPASGGDGGWFSNHWKWVVMLIVLVVGITGIWIGACIWRRRYLRKKDRLYELGKQRHPNSDPNAHASWGPGAAPSHPNFSGPGMFMSNDSAVSSGANGSLTGVLSEKTSRK